VRLLLGKGFDRRSVCAISNSSILLYNIGTSYEMHKSQGYNAINSQKLIAFTFRVCFVDGNHLLHFAFLDKAFRLPLLQMTDPLKRGSHDKGG